MSIALTIEKAGPGLTVQDAGRQGWLALGLSQSGAADRVALAEGAALLGQSIDCAAIEMTAFGGDFIANGRLRFALTGAPMTATLDGATLAWNSTYMMESGQRLSIGAAMQGIYGYLHVGGGIAAPMLLGSRSMHLAAGVGAALPIGAVLPIGEDKCPHSAGLTLDAGERFRGGTVRVLPTIHTALFDGRTHNRFFRTQFQRTMRGNRQGAELTYEGAPFVPQTKIAILSEPMQPGDIQIAGDGSPFVLLAECQTTGGYPRIASILPADVPIVAQAAPGVPLRFAAVSEGDALEAHQSYLQQLANMRSRTHPLIRRFEDIPNLLSHQLISGVVTGWETE